jgi:hypothetical protein
MGRRVDVEPAPLSADDRRAGAEHRYLWLQRSFLAVEPDSPGAAAGEAIRAKVKGLDQRGGPIETRLARLEDHLADAGLLDVAARFADRFSPTTDAPQGAGRRRRR